MIEPVVERYLLPGLRVGRSAQPRFRRLLAEQVRVSDLLADQAGESVGASRARP